MESKSPESGGIGQSPARMKQELRRLIRSRIAGQDTQALAGMSASICRHLALLIQSRSMQRIALFAARPGEVDLMSLVDMLPEQEWYFPVVQDGRRLSFRRVVHAGDFTEGFRNIREPRPECPPLEAGKLDLIVLPGAAFTMDGQRLGYGGGFYDTLLEGLDHHVCLVGVCFSCQILDDLPVEPHDRSVDQVILP